MKYSQIIHLQQKDHPFNKWMIFLSIVMGIFMVNLDSSILSVALPVFQDIYQAEPMTLQWLMVGYLLAMTAILPAVGALSDRYGRARCFIIGIVIFTIASVLCALSPNLLQLNLFRIVKGIGGAFITANGMAIIILAFPKGSRGKPLGLIGSVVSIATLSGPVLGGVLLEHLGWRSIFLINLPVGIVVLGLCLIFVKGMQEINSTKHFDIQGAILFFLGTTSLITFLSLGPMLGWTDRIILLTMGLSIAFLSIFFIWEWKHESPIINLKFFTIPEFLIGNLTKYISFVMLMFYLFMMPFYLDGMGYSVVYIGFLMAIQPVFNMITAPIGGWLGDRFNKNLIALSGMCVLSIGYFLIYLLKDHSYNHSLMVYFSIALIGIGMGLFQPPNNVSILESVSDEHSGIASSIIAIIRNFARVSGVCIATIFFYIGEGQSTGQHVVESASFIFLVAMILAFFAVLLTLLLIIIDKKRQKALTNVNASSKVY